MPYNRSGSWKPASLPRSTGSHTSGTMPMRWSASAANRTSTPCCPISRTRATRENWGSRLT